jgi:hypothetical protein
MRATAAPPLSPGRLAAALVKEAPVDQTHFDALTRSLARRPTRRGALRLLIGGLLGGMVSGRTWTLAHALQRPDRDQDGLYDDDEVNVYGTNPDVFDTDGDGTGDGEEIYRRDNGLGGPSNPLVNDNAPPPDNDGEFCPDCGLQGPPKGRRLRSVRLAGSDRMPGAEQHGVLREPGERPEQLRGLWLHLQRGWSRVLWRVLPRHHHRPVQLWALWQRVRIQQRLCQQPLRICPFATTVSAVG